RGCGRRAPAAHRFRARDLRIRLPAHGSRAQAGSQPPAGQRRRRQRTHSCGSRPQAPGNPGQGLCRVPGQARRRRCHCGRHLRQVLRPGSRVLQLLQEPRRVPFGLRRPQRHPGPESGFGFLPLLGSRRRRQDRRAARRPLNEDRQTMMSSWLLPENLSDVLPAEARRIEELRRELLDLYRTYGFELVAPPMVEYLDSLMPADDQALRLRACALVDQLSGLALGVRADMTIQVSRIDAHLLNREGVTRLCYCGPVVHGRAAGLLSDRELLQIGAEIFGHAGVQADIESIRLALESVRRAGVRQPRLDLNHPGIGRALVDADPALAEAADAVFALLSAKDVPG